MRTFNNDSKFDIQLAHANRCENALHERITGAKIELKTETFQWEKTGNIAIEYEYRGRPSGIATTEADFWVHELRREDQTLVYLMLPTEVLKRVCRQAYREGLHRSGGDSSYSKVILLPINRVLTLL